MGGTWGHRPWLVLRRAPVPPIVTTLSIILHLPKVGSVYFMVKMLRYNIFCEIRALLRQSIYLFIFDTITNYKHRFLFWIIICLVIMYNGVNSGRAFLSQIFRNFHFSSLTLTISSINHESHGFTVNNMYTMYLLWVPS